MAQNTRDRLLDVAFRMFAERGFHAVSLAQVADEIGLTKQALIHHFKTKEGLYAQVLERLSGRFVTGLEELAARTAPAEVRLRAFFLFFCEEAMQNPDEIRLILREVMDGRDPADAAANRALKRFVEQLADLIGQTDRWSSGTRAEALAVAFQLLGAVSFFAVSEPTLVPMFGKRESTRMKTAYPAALDDLIERWIAPR